MAVLVWGNVGERYYEAGVDRGVLFPKTGSGVPWNGLISVSESPNGGEPRPYYLDGFKYLNLATAEEFAATIDAFSAPAEFSKCDGTASIHNGLYITQQTREHFGFCYRTRIGNDTDGTDLGYKIHLVYNALAAPSSRSNSTLNDSPSPITFSWNITTNPPEIEGFKPSAHFVIDSRNTPLVVLTLIESILYGSPTTSSRMPAVAELMSLFEEFLLLKAQLVEDEVYTIVTVDEIDNAAAVISPVAPPPIPGTPILWFDSSVPGYVTLSLITGD